jgi:cell division protein FtsA
MWHPKENKSAERRILASLDIGTSKTAVVIGDVTEGPLQILGVGSVKAEGFKKGVIIDLEQAMGSIQNAVHEAELTAGVEIKDLIVGIGGEHIKGVNSRGVVAVQRPDQGIAPRDVDRVIDTAKAFEFPTNREILHVLPQEFIVDGQRGIRNAVGITGVRLEAEIHIITGASTTVKSIVRCVKNAGYHVADLVLGSLASSFAVLDKDQRELGVACIDVGGGVVEVVLFHEDSVRHSAVVELGGQNVTNDIALGLKTTTEQAEDVKKRHGCCFEDLVEQATFTIPGQGAKGPREVSRDVLFSIIQPRVEEILSMVWKEAMRSDYHDKLGAGVVLTGGGSLMPGIEELAERIFGLPAQVGAPRNVSGLGETVTSPIYSSAVGLLFYEMNAMGSSTGTAVSSSLGGWSDGLSNWFKHFKNELFGY